MGLILGRLAEEFHPDASLPDASLPELQVLTSLCRHLHRMTYPTRTDKGPEVSTKLLQEVVPQFGLPHSLQTDTGGLTYFHNNPVHSQSPRQKVCSTLLLEAPNLKKGRKSQSIPQKQPLKTNPGSFSKITLLSICRITPKDPLRLSLHEALCRCPFPRVTILCNQTLNVSTGP